MLWLISLATLSGGTALACARWRRWSWRRRKITLLVLAASAVGLILLWPGALVASKVAVALAMPCGLLWLLLLGTALWLYLRARWREFALVVALAGWFSVASSPWSAALLIGWLESDYEGIDPLAQGPFDAVFVLGGGTNTGPNGREGLSSVGDRVLTGARLYLSGRTGVLVTSGTRIYPRDDSGKDLAEETSLVWQALRIPAQAIRLLPGQTTREESVQVAELVAESGWQRIGVVTSASHMRRALRLLRAAGVEAAPLPANFIGATLNFAPTDFIPNATSLESFTIACKEILAPLVGR
jgi:uncharacterized SAM-binding protein YcdF (DUF218 family)